MIVIGLITVALILGLYGNNSFKANNLGASAFLGIEDTNLNTSSSGIYTPVLNTNYTVSAFRTSNTRSITTTSSGPATTTETYYYTTTEPSLPDESGYYPIQGYVPVGCENGTDYSTVTNEPCG